MKKVRLYLESVTAKPKILLKNKEDLHKIKNVLRLKPGQKIYLFNGAGKEWECLIKEIGKNRASLTKIKKIHDKKKKKTILTIAFPLIQEKKINLILQKTTELGVSEFLPFAGERTLPLDKNLIKIRRWKKIITEACRQSERLWLPKINPPALLEELLDKKFDLKFLALAGGQKKIPDLSGQKNILCLVGPEGGFSENELKKIRKNNFLVISLSPYTLRTETAAIFATGLLKYKNEN